jgi:hypothetical protein
MDEDHSQKQKQKSPTQIFYAKHARLNRRWSTESPPAIEPGKLSLLISPKFYAPMPEPDHTGRMISIKYDLEKYELGSILLYATGIRREIFDGFLGLDVTDKTPKKKGAGYVSGTLMLTSQLAPLVPVIERLLETSPKKEVPIVLHEYGRSNINMKNKKGAMVTRVLVTVTEMDVYNMGQTLRYNPEKPVQNRDLGVTPSFDIYTYAAKILGVHPKHYAKITKKFLNKKGTK